MHNTNEIFFNTEAGTPATGFYDDATSSEFSIIETTDQEEPFIASGSRMERRGAVGTIPGIAGAILATTKPVEVSDNGHKPLQAMDTLKPPGYLQPGSSSDPNDSSNSPPRSNSVDLSTLRRDIELWSISSGDVSEIGSENEYEPATPAESVRTVRSRSHDPTQSPDHILRRPSRIEHLSEIFRFEQIIQDSIKFFPRLSLVLRSVNPC